MTATLTPPRTTPTPDRLDRGARGRRAEILADVARTHTETTATERETLRRYARALVAGDWFRFDSLSLALVDRHAVTVAHLIDAQLIAQSSGPRWDDAYNGGA